jgi:hypothetical protein
MTFRDVLRIEVMRRVFYAQVVSLFGDFLALFAVIAVVSFACTAHRRSSPGADRHILPMPVGRWVFVDRWPLKPTPISSDLRPLALLLIPSTQVWHVYLALASLSCVLVLRPAQRHDPLSRAGIGPHVRQR